MDAEMYGMIPNAKMEARGEGTSGKAYQNV